MNANKAILTLCLFLLGFAVFAQQKPFQKPKKKEKEPELTKQEKKEKRLKNIEFINKSVMLRPAYSLQSNNLRVTHKNGEGSPLNYRPNVWGSAGGQLKLGGLSVSYMYRLPVSTTNLTNLGKTEYQNIGLNVQTRYIGLEFDYSNYNGFYLANKDDVPFLPITDGARTLVPGLDYFTVGLKTTVAFKKDFSINAAFNQTERMKKGAGSFMLTIGNRVTRLNSDTSFIAYDQQQYHKKFSEHDFNGVTFNSTYIALGAGHSFVKGYFSFTPIILFGTGPQLQWYKDREKARFGSWHLRMPLYLSYRNALGYNHDNFFFRVIWSAELNQSQIKPKGTYNYIGNENPDMRYINYRDESDNTMLNMFHLNLEVSLGVRFIEKKTKEEKKAKRAAKKN